MQEVQAAGGGRDTSVGPPPGMCLGLGAMHGAGGSPVWGRGSAWAWPQPCACLHLQRIWLMT